MRVEVSNAESFARRVTKLRINRLDGAVSVIEVLFSRTDWEGLSHEECQSLRASSLIGLRFVELPSFDEIVSSGRLNIIQDDKLRTAPITLRQNIVAADRSIVQIMAIQPDLVADFPAAFTPKSVTIPEVTTRREVGVEGICNASWMKNSQAFLNTTTKSVDDYDAFIRDVVIPWREGISKVNKRRDKVNSINKGNE